MSDEQLRRLLNDPAVSTAAATVAGEEDAAVTETGAHPEAACLARYRLAPDELSAEERRSLAAHLAACDQCRGDLDGLATFDFSAVRGGNVAPPRARRLWSWIVAPPRAPRPALSGAASFALGALLVHLLLPVRWAPTYPGVGGVLRERETLAAARLALADAKLALAREKTELARERDAVAGEKLRLAQQMREETRAAAAAPAGAADTPVQTASDGEDDDKGRQGLAVAGEPITVRMIADSLAGNVMASGLPYDPNALVAASARHPLGTRIIIINPYNGKSVKVTVLDRHGRASGGIVISRAAYEALGYDADRPGNPRAEFGVVSGL